MFLHKVKAALKNRISQAAINVALRLNWPALAALGLWAVSYHVNKKNGPGVLCMARSIFLDDVKALTDHSGQCSYIVVPRGSFFRMLEHFSPKGEIVELTEDNYHTSDLCHEGKIKYRKFLSKLLPHLKNLLDFDAVISANFGYKEQQEWAEVCRQAKIPFIVFFKEGMAVPEHMDAYVARYRTRKCNADRILFYNDFIRSKMIAARIPGIEEDNSVTVGIPRFDQYIKNQTQQPESKQITLFTFYLSDKLAYVSADTPIWAELQKRSDDFHAMFIRYAIDNPDTKVLIHPKIADKYIADISRIASRFPKLPPNLELFNRELPFKLIQESYAIAGFNSTTLFEGIVSARKILSPDFNDLFQGKPWDYFTRHKELVSYVKDYEDLVEKLKQDQPSEKEKTQREDFLKNLVGFTDGRSSRRAEGVILATINTARTSRQAGLTSI